MTIAIEPNAPARNEYTLRPRIASERIQVPLIDTKERIKRKRAAPSRWCSGSRSFAPRATKRIDEPRDLAIKRQAEARPEPMSATMPPLLLCFLVVRFLLATRSILGGEFYWIWEGAPTLDFDDNRDDHRLSSMFLPDPCTNCSPYNLR